MRLVADTLILIAGIGLLAGCAAVERDTRLAQGDGYYCRPGSMLKYKRPLDGEFGGYWVRVPAGGTCRGY